MCAPVSNNPLVMENLCNDAPRAQALPATQKNGVSKPAQESLTLTAAQINSMRLTESPIILMGDVLVFEANREDFVLEIYLSNGKEIVTQPQVAADAQGVVVGWKKGRAKLDYADSLKQYIIGMKITALHQSGAPLLLRGVKIDRKGRYILELEKSNPGPQRKQFEPPMSYPPDPHVMTASVTMPSLGRESQTGFIASHIPAFSMVPMMFQTSGADGNHYKYTGKEFDAETGLYYYGARYYSPALGRFTSPDPVMIKIDRLLDPQRLNLYAYAANNPVTYRDPDGRDLVSGSGDQKQIKSALKEIASHPGGREFLQKMDNLTQTIRLSTGTGMKRNDGSPTPGRNGPAPAENPAIVRTRDSSNKIVDVKGPTIEVTIDPAMSQMMRDTHDPDAPKSNAELLGHELKEVEQKDFQLPHSETGTTLEIDAILDTKVDKNLQKSAEKFVDDLLKPNPQPTPTPAATPTPELKDKKEPN
jgi:RHS repeat-associated protein